MRGTTDTDVARSDHDAPQAEASPLTPAWLDRLLRGDDEPDEIFTLRHVQGPPAMVARIRGAIGRAVASMDAAVERDACWKLTQHLVSQGFDYASVSSFAKRALRLGITDDQRLDLSAWFESMGDLIGAADVLEPLAPRARNARQAAGLLVRQAGLLMRMGRGTVALDALLQASSVWPGSAEALDLAADLAASLGLPEASSMLLEAADRHEGRGEKAAAFEARRRAFELAPQSEQVADALIDALDKTSRWDAADAVLRSHANASQGDRRVDAHRRRVVRAMEHGHTASAVAAVCDARLEAAVDDPSAAMVDDLMQEAGLHDLLAARWLARARSSSGPDRAECWAKLASLYMGRLASPDRALDAWIEVVAANPAHGQALSALRSHARTMHDPTPLAEALLRGSLATDDDSVAAACLRELADLAEDRLADPSLAFWAYEQMGKRGCATDETAAAMQRLAPRVRLQDGALSAAREALENASSPDARIEALRRIASMLRGRPGQAEEYLQVLRRLLDSGQQERRWWVDFERTARRMGRLDDLMAAMKLRLEAGCARAEQVHFRASLVELRMAQGDLAGALDEARVMTRELGGARPSAAYVWFLGALAYDDRARAEGMEAVAGTLAPAVRATLYALAGELHLEAERTEEATRLANLAQRADPNAARVVWFLAALAIRTGDPAGATSIERAWTLFIPEGAHHESLAMSFERSGDLASAHAWLRRWYEIRPWDERVAHRLIAAAVALGRSESIEDAMVRAMSGVHAWAQLAPSLASGLRAVQASDATRALSLAKRLLERGAVAFEPLRAALIDVARSNQDLVFELAVLERSCALPDSEIDPSVLLRIAALHGQLGHGDGEARALSRCARSPAHAMDVLSRLESATGVQTGDAILWRLEAQAEALQALGTDHPEVAAGAWLRVGAAKWSLGGDRDGAMSAWVRGAEILQDGTFARLGAAVSRFAGDGAPGAIGEYAQGLTDPAQSSALLVVAAALALRADRADVALRYATSALEKAPTRTEALLLIERASGKVGDPGAIDKAYELVARGSKGRFGRRAAHYRASRTLEARGFAQLAIVHATAAFEADPVDGAVLGQMMRLADKIDPTDVIQTLVRVSDRETDPEARAFWLRCAARLASKHGAHERSGLDLALRALLLSPSAEAVEILQGAMRAVLRTDPDDRELLQLRVERAVRPVTAKLDGPRGARVAIAMTRLCADVLGSSGLAWDWLRAAFGCSGDIDEYGQLLDMTMLLAAQRDVAASFVDDVIARGRGLGGTTGPQLLALSLAIARALGDVSRIEAVEAAEQAALRADQAPEPVDVFGDLLGEAQAAGAPVPAEAQGGLASDGEAEVAPASEAQATAGPRLEIVELDPVRQAESLETIGELAAAIEVLEAEIDRDPDRQREIDPHLRRLYEAAANNTKLVMVLERIAARTESSQDRLPMLVELAGIAEARGDLQGARAKWDQVAQIDPLHAGAAAFLERDAVEAGDDERLADLLGRRIAATTDPSDKKSLRLRLAMLFEHRLGRPDRAAVELDALVAEGGEDADVLRARAELAASVGDERTAAQSWLRAARAALTPADAAAHACKAASVFVAMGHEQAAREAIALAGPVRSPEVLALLVDIERMAKDPVALGAALDELATSSHAPEKARAGWLLEAAELAVASGHVDIAQERAARAERLDPGDPRTVLGRVLVDYRVAGLGNRAQVAAMLARLEAIADKVSAADFGLHAYLTAEAIEALSGREAAYQLLRERSARAPADPLIALGQAERLASAGRAGEALPLFDITLQAKELGALRTRAQVAFAAARAALAAGGPVLAAPYIAEVQRQPDAHELVDRLRREAAEPAGVSDEMRKQLERVARESMGPDRARALRQIARTWAARGTRAAMAEADAYYVEAIAAAGADALLRAQIEAEREGFRRHATPSERPPTTRSYPPVASVEPEQASPPSTTPYPGTESLPGPRDSHPPATRSYPPPQPSSPAVSPRVAAPVRSDPPTAPVPTPLAPAVTFGRPSDLPPPRERSASGPTYSIVEPRAPRPSRAPSTESAEEKDLFARLAQGDIEAGDRLAALIQGERGRSHDLVAVRRRQVVLDPGNLKLLEMLRDAALADHDRAHALAVEHAMDVLSGSPRPLQAPLAVPPDDPARLHAMLGRGVHTDATEILAWVWENAPHVFAREPAAFGVTGLERVVVGAPTPVGRAYAMAGRALGLARVPVFQKRTAGPVTMAVALLQSPAVMIAGEAREDDPELAYRLGLMLAATLPNNVMLFGMTSVAVRQLMVALMAAFGPPEATRGRESESAILAGELWRALPGRVQRRMQQILRDSPFVYEELWARALQSSRRAGLFVVADLRIALQDVMADPGNQERIDASAPEALQTLCRVSTSAADLVRFATSVEYAQARWRDDVPRRSLPGLGF